MTKKLLFVVSLLLVLALAAFAADVTGKWTYEQQGRGGNPTTVTLTLKADGGTVTGTESRPGRGGNGTTDTQVTNGKIDGDKISFDISREFNGNTMTTTYKGTVKGDTIDFEVTRPGRGGEPMTNKVTAKKATT
ncbi:MAG TPA: hypothetical protein VN736_16835 [Candidatus Limnocylindrales bacterium]|nr:hypothetical protein [Candidatus Limnocylindrales bacterium]